MYLFTLVKVPLMQRTDTLLHGVLVLLQMAFLGNYNFVIASVN